jgi:hypothetical protein
MNTVTITLTMMLCLGFAAVAGGQPLLDCSNASVIACDETQINSTPPGKAGAGNVTWYCDGAIPWSYADAWEFVYEFTFAGGPVRFLMTYDHSGTNDLDLLVLSLCDEDLGCFDPPLGTGGVTGVEEIVTDLPAGTYYIVVDGYNGQQDGSPHTMTIECGVVPVASATWGAIKAAYK